MLKWSKCECMYRCVCVCVCVCVCREGRGGGGLVVRYAPGSITVVGVLALRYAPGDYLGRPSDKGQVLQTGLIFLILAPFMQNDLVVRQLASILSSILSSE